MVQARILTFNTLYRGNVRARVTALGHVLESSDHDIVCLQELWDPRNLALVRGIAASYGYAAHAARLPIVHGGLAILSRHPITHHRFTPYRLRGRPRRELLSRKGVLSARVRIGGESITVVSTHMSANMSARWERGFPFTLVQQAELRELAAEIAKVRTSEPLVAVGDFNVPRDSWLFEEFVEASGLVDAFDGSPEPTYRPTERWAGKALDQLLVSPGVAVEAELALTEAVTLADGRSAFLSDHYGIQARLSA
jgi:endonuclease/exonuclease/phosphatase family metal-dependent hydrolase